MKLFTLIAVPLALMAQGYTLILTTKNGETIKYETEDIEKMEFESSAQTVTPLDAPTLQVTNQLTGVTITWNNVSNAVSYRQVLDNGAPVVNSSTTATFADLTPGTHTFSVIAIPSDSQYSESAPATATFEIKAPAEVKQVISVNSVTSTSIKAQILPITEPYYVGIVPRSKEYIPDDKLIAAVSSSSNKKALSTSGLNQTVQFDNLDPDTNYIIVAYPQASGAVSRYFTRTYIDLTPGTKGTLWAPGVDGKSGIIDVDKVGDLSRYGWQLYVDENSLSSTDIPSNTDGGMCWACTASGLIQWWLNDYKNKTGQDYPMKYPEAIPAQSKCYSTPIMDVMNDAFGWNEGASCHDAIKWFFAGYYDHPLIGTPSDPRNTNLVGAPHKPDYPYWKGGFLGMTYEEAQSYIVSNEEANDGYAWFDQNMYYSCAYSIPKTATADEAAEKFSKLNIDAFMQGPVYICFAKHAMSAWGVDYEILADGTPRITKIHYCENTIHSTNKINSLQDGIDGNIEYNQAKFPPHLVGKYLPLITNRIEGQYTLLNCNGLRGWQPK